MAKKQNFNYYVIIKGRLVGYTSTWKACSNLVERFPRNKYKGFMTLDDARRYHFSKTNCTETFKEISYQRAMAVERKPKHEEGLEPELDTAPDHGFVGPDRRTKADQLRDLIHDSSNNGMPESLPAADQAPLNKETSLYNGAFRAGTATLVHDAYLANGSFDFEVDEFPDDFEFTSAEGSKASLASSSQSTSGTFATSSIVSTPSSSPITQPQLATKTETPEDPPSKRARTTSTVSNKASYLYSNGELKAFIRSFKEILNASKVVDLMVTGKVDGTPAGSGCAITSPPPPPYCKDSFRQRDWLDFFTAVKSIFKYYPAISVEIGKHVKDES